MKTASPSPATHQVTLRLPEDLHELLRKVARARRTSINSLLRQMIEELNAAERERVLEEAYAVLGGDSREGAEPFFEAQAEVARRG